ncbi:hypothetical protein FNV43_RR20606 [Rhamnella rubrinervis]|uniref:Uncharacterized protein n=1 Tax=Rhamnella rubrinervis TaxID=2594499 RepID=A0A8K0E1R5_9ROSA|nr:hypothetical protein FNV43_RR20606 [Rhamnella rubrinervis]
MCNQVHGKLVLIVGNALICQKWYLGALLCGAKCVWHGQVGTHGHAVALGTVGAVAHVQPSAWEVDFDCWECSHMPKLIFGSLIVRGKMCLARTSWNACACGGTRGHCGGAVAHVQPSAWGVGFDCWECSHMPKVIFGSLIVRGKMCLARTSWNAWACGGTRGHRGGGLWHMFNQVHGKLILIVGNALICQK